MDGRFTAKEVFEARDRIRDYVYKTPLEQSIYLGRDGREYFFKLESLQTVKSFKIRGAINKMLTLTDEPVTEIAFSCGFDDMSYFSKTFKKYKGISPSDYRKAAKKT